MGKKKRRQQQYSDIPVAVCSSESGDAQDAAVSVNQTPPKPICQHSLKAIEFCRLKKSINSAEVECTICQKLGKTPTLGSDTWLCLKCGVRTCSVKHSEEHHEIPHSDLHCLAIQLPDFITRCHSCGIELSEDSNKKLKVCVTTLRQLHSRGQLNFKGNSLEAQKTVKEETSKSDGPTSTPASSERWVDLWETPPPPPLVRGLTNLGNTCFFNSVLQCLARTPNLISVLKQMNAPNQPIDITLKGGKHLVGKLDKWDALSESLADTLESLLSGGGVFSPHKLFNLLRKKFHQFDGYDQQDAHELLRHLLDAIRTSDLKRYRRVMLAEMGLSSKVNPQEVREEVAQRLKALDHEVCEAVTLVPEQVFRGLLASTLQCQECSSTSQCIESFLDLSLPVMSEKPQPPSCRRKNNQGGAIVIEEKGGGQLSKHQLRKERRKGLAKNHSGGHATRKRQEDVGGGAAEPTIPERDEKGGSDVDGDVEDNEGCEDKRHESGYSSEKLGGSVGGETPSVSSASDSARASPSSITEAMDALHIQPPPSSVVNRPPIPIPPEHIDVVTPCSTNYLADSQQPVSDGELYICTGLPPIKEFPEYLRHRTEPGYVWSVTNACSEREKRISDESSVQFSKLVMPPPLEKEKAVCSEWLLKDGSPDISRLLLRDSNGPELKVRVRSGLTIMKEDQDWRNRLNKFHSWESAGRVNKSNYSASTCRFNTEFRLHDIVEESNIDDERAKGGGDTITGENFKKKEKDESYGGGECGNNNSGEYFTEKVDSASLTNVENSSLPMVFDVSRIAKGVLAQVSAFLQKEKQNDPTIDDVKPKLEDDDEPAYGEGSKMEVMAEEEITPLGAEVNESKLILFNPDVVTPAKRGSDSDWDYKESQKCPSEEENKNLEEVKPLLADDDLATVPTVLPLPYTNSLASTSSKGSLTSSSLRHDGEGDCSVLTCLNQFISIELMTGNNKVGCTTCTTRAHKGNKEGKTVYTMSTKQLLIKKAPPVLILHLKRFQVQMFSFRKLSRHVAFPLVLDLAPFCVSTTDDKSSQGDDGVFESKSLQYCLYGVVEHSGTINGGHYVAYVKVDNSSLNRWYCISDSHFHEVTESRVLGSQAYLLFYRQFPT